MTATFPDAVCQGPFFQITSQAEGEALAPFWVDWNNGSGMIGRIGATAMAIRAATTRYNTLPNIRARLWLIQAILAVNKCAVASTLWFLRAVCRAVATTCCALCYGLALGPSPTFIWGKGRVVACPCA
jgi:hypothetical protein